MTSCPPWVRPDDPPDLINLLSRLGDYRQDHGPYNLQFTPQNVERHEDEMWVCIPITEVAAFDQLNQHFGLCHIVWTDGRTSDTLLAIVKLHELACWPRLVA